MPIDDQHMDVLQSIEFAVIRVYEEYPEMTDYAVERTYEALIDAYAAEKLGRPPREWQPSEVERELCDWVRHMCEWRLGRGPLSDSPADATPEPPPPPIDMDTLVLCLKRLRKSARKWPRELGRQGYLDFVQRLAQ